MEGTKVPSSIYSSAMIASLGLSSEDFRNWRTAIGGILLVISQWALVLFNYFICIKVIISVKQFRGNKIFSFSFAYVSEARSLSDVSPECPADFTLLMLGVSVFSVYNMGEIVETCGIGFWLWQFPHSDQ
jgi:hypothetical protein